MKLIMESWRNYLSEQEKLFTDKEMNERFDFWFEINILNSAAFELLPRLAQDFIYGELKTLYMTGGLVLSTVEDVYNFIKQHIG